MVINIKKNKGKFLKILVVMLMVLTLTILSDKNSEKTILTSSQELSTKKT